MPTPTWQGATAGYSALAGSVNQFLGTHAITYVYQGVLQANQPTSSGTNVDSNSLWLAQSFAAGASQTTVGYVQIRAAVTGSPPPWTFSIQANVSGAPSGTPLVSSALPKEFLTGSATTVSVMLPVTGLTGGATYWIVAQAAGDPSDYYLWAESNQTSGASTSANGTSWTAQTYGLRYAVYDQTTVPPVAGAWEDSGARWTSWSYNGSGQLTGLKEFTAGQSAAGYTASARALTYASGLLTGVA